MKRLLLTLGFFFFVFLFHEANAQQNNYALDIRNIFELQREDGSLHPDTFSLGFNIYRNRGTSDETRIRNLDLNKDIRIIAEERIGDQLVSPPEYLEGSLQLFDKVASEAGIMEDITVSLLVDRSGSIQEEEMLQIRNAVEAFVNTLPDGSVFLSYFHNFISPSYQVTRATFHEAADTLLTRTRHHTDLHNAVITKILEFDTLAHIPNQIFNERFGYQRKNELARRASRNNFLIVLSDGLDDDGSGYTFPNPKYHPHPNYPPPDPDINRFDIEDVYDYIRSYRDEVTVYTIGFGAERSDFEDYPLLHEILEGMATASGNPDGYIYVDPEGILDLLTVELPDALMPDYRATFVNPDRKVFRGERRDLRIRLEIDDIKAGGDIHFHIGSIANPIELKGRSVWEIMAWGVVAGLILILLVLIIIQLIWPLINNQIFFMRHKKRYKAPANEQKRTCPYCLDTIHENDKVIRKCAHIVHFQCWTNNDHMCPEYGQNCTTGKQSYFDINDPFARKNKVYYLNWVLYGFIGGFFAWITYLLLKDMTIWNNIAAFFVSWLTTDMEAVSFEYEQKLAPLYVLGMVMGFFLTFLFAWAEDYRKKTVVTVLRFLVRSLIGALIGFLSFIAGGMLIILFKEPHTSLVIDWIPWLIFGVLLGLSLSVRTTIHWKHGLLGGLFSILFSFIMLYYLGYTLAGNIAFIGPVISFMIYGAGLGGSIATVRSTAEQYFLKIVNGPRNGTHIAIHKWMSSQSGLNEVYIGSSNVCEIQMNWEKSNDIAEKHVKLFLNVERNMPVMVSLEKGSTTLYDERVEMTPGKEYDLLNGTTFTIGETIFQYVEK